MPTLNKYTDEDGYYILARPSDTGNITYQLKPRGEQIIEKVGYQDGDDIGWQVISALKIPNLVYTGDEGTAADDMSVDLGKEKINALSEEDAKQLLDELSSIPRVGDTQTDELQKILDISFDSEPDLYTLSNNIARAFHREGIIEGRDQRVFQNSVVFSDGNFLPVGDDVRDNQKEEYDGIDFKFEFIAEHGEKFGNKAFFVTIGVAEKEGIISYVTKTHADITIELVVKYQKLMSDMLPIIISKLESEGIETGTPESLPPPNVVNTDVTSKG